MKKVLIIMLVLVLPLLLMAAAPVAEGAPLFGGVADAFDQLMLDWSTLGFSVVVVAAVYLFGMSGLAKSGNSKRVAGFIAALAIAAFRIQILEVVPLEYGQVALTVMNGLTMWLVSALMHTGIEISKAGIEARQKQLEE